MRQGENFSSNGLETSLFLLGKNRRGQWVAQDQSGKRGGLFVSQAAALKFALFENGKRPELLVSIPGVFELDMTGATFPAEQKLAA
jgi:hypothetical protein